VAPRPTRADGGGGRDTTWLLALTAILFAWYAAPFVVHDLHFPLGPDGPVYLWWARLAGFDGLSAVARPGVPAVALTLAGAFHLPLTAVTAGLEISLGVAVSLASWALARDARAERWTAFGAGVLAGTFGVHLASGYLATLGFAVAFVAAIVALGRADRRATVAAALALVAATLSHPLFGLLALVILAVLVALSWRDHGDEATRVVTAIVGAIAACLVAFLALRIGPAPLAVDTSRDGFLRRAGLGDVLRSAYLDRFIHRWTRYVEWLSLPLVALGWKRPKGFARRALVAWTLVTVAGVAVSLVTRWFPPDRFITFGFAIPILAAFGLAVVAAWLRPRARWLARGVPAVAVVVMVSGAWIAWSRQEPFISETEVRQVTLASAAADLDPIDEPLAFLIAERDDTASFLATRAGNVIRAAVDPARIRDVVVVVSQVATSSPERRALAELTNDDLRHAVEAHGELRGFALSAFTAVEDRLDAPSAGGSQWAVVDDGGVATTGGPRRVFTAVDPLEPASTAEIGITAALTLLAFWITGYGWARAARLERAAAVAIAPALGWCAFVIVGITLERLGVPLTGSVGPTTIAAVSGLGGFVLWRVLERGAGAHPSPQVEQEPAE
jgi:hypothetical protein